MIEAFENAGVDLQEARLVLSAFYAFVEQEADKEASGGYSHFLYPVSTSSKEPRAVCAKALQCALAQCLLEIEATLPS